MVGRPPVRQLPGGRSITPVKQVSTKSVDPTVRDYTKGVVGRALGISKDLRRDVAIPDLGLAMQNFRPEKDGALTLREVAQSQENIRSMGNPQSGERQPGRLSNETLGGLKAIHEATVKEQESVKKRIEGETPSSASEPDTSIPRPPPKKTGMSEEDKQRLAETSDLDFDLMMSKVRSDVINNLEERKAVEATLKPLDLMQGLLSGEFTQLVPIRPGKLEVLYRTITPFENEMIKRRVLQKILEDERYSQLHTDSYGAMQVVASLQMINGAEQPSHLKSVGQGRREFLWDVFDKKCELFSHYPTPLIHALSVHASWFDLRVRAEFSNTALKNG